MCAGRPPGAGHESHGTLKGRLRSRGAAGIQAVPALQSASLLKTGRRKRDVHLWAFGKRDCRLEVAPRNPQFSLLRSTPLYAGPLSTLASQAEHNESCSFLTCRQATLPSPKFKVPTTSSPSLYTDLKIPNVPTFPRPSLILYRSEEDKIPKGYSLHWGIMQD